MTNRTTPASATAATGAGGVGKEANAAVAGGAVLAELSAVPYRVELALEHIMGEVTCVAALATTGFLELRAGSIGVVEATGIPSTGSRGAGHSGERERKEKGKRGEQYYSKITRR